MISVECESCNASYQLDERRLPAAGIKMRCTKCGSSFMVYPGGAPEVPAPQAAPPLGGPAAARVPKRTLLGAAAVQLPVAAPRAMPAADPDADLPAPAARRALLAPSAGAAKPLAPPVAAPPVAAPPVAAPARPPAPPVPAGARPPAPPAAPKTAPTPYAPKPPPPSSDELDIDLPAPRSANIGLGHAATAPAPSRATPSDDLDLDLPAPRAAAKPASAVPIRAPIAPPIAAHDDLDLPAPAAARAFAKPVAASPLVTVPAKARVAAPAQPAAPRAPTPAPLGDEPSDEFDFDLPVLRGPAAAPVTAAPAAPARPAAGLSDDLDLPAPRGASRPLAPPPSLSSGALDLDLPRVAGKPPASSALDLDLPAPRDPSRPLRPPPSLSSGALDLDLPAPRGAAARPDSAGDELTLQRKTGEVLRAAESAFSDLDLPMPSRSASTDVALRKAPQPFGDLDLPQVHNSLTDLPQVRSGSVDLPQIKSASPFGELDLPTPRVSADLPALKSNLDLPAHKPAGAGTIAGFGDLDLPIARGSADLPAPRIGGSLDLIDLPTPVIGSDLPAVRGGLDLPAPQTRRSRDSLSPGIGDELDFGGSAEAADALRSRDGKRGVGGAAFGELDLDAGGGGFDEGMEFGDLPQAPAGSAATAGASIGVGEVPAERARQDAKKKKKDADGAPKPRGRGLAVAVGFLVLLAGAGAALGATPYGFFGIYALERFLPAAGNAARARAAITAAERLAATDTYTDARAGLGKLASARREMGLNRPLLARSALHEALYQQRYGVDSASSSRVSTIFARLDERGVTGDGVPLARAADALMRGESGAAQAKLAAAGASNDGFAEILAGEIALARGAAPEAVTAFRAALTHAGGARAQWGLARALLAGESADAAAAIDATLAASPAHIGARVAKARIADAAGDADTAIRLTREAAGLALVGTARLRGSSSERVDALRLLGAVQERRAHLREASDAYEAALRLAPQQLESLIGAGRVLLGQQRYADALARFEAALAVTPHPPAIAGKRSIAQEAKLGAGRALLQLERAQDAKATLLALLQELPTDPDVLLALGRAEVTLEDQAAAEHHFREAVTAAPERFEGYLALARLFTKTGRTSDATAFLEEAARRVPQTAEVRRLLGESELEQNRIPEAIAHFRAALALAPTDDGATFGLGVAQRRSGALVEAAANFDSLAQRDAEYPGLSLERGIVYEAQGQADRATRMYEAALRGRPDDPDLLLRLGASQVAAGQIDAAEQTLARVANARPNSPEAEHFMGRVAFARGNTQGAQQHFDRAVSLDGTRGEFHLYSGWAALESGNFGKALEQVDAAIARDPSLGDAYWIRGEVRLRSGAVQDALDDFEKALSLKPGRHEAWAGVAECYDQLRRRGDAIRAYANALQGDDDNGAWWYRIGRLQLDDDRSAEARASLNRAVLLGEAMDARPGWLPDSHRLLAETMRLGGERAGALEHLRRYLEIASPGAIDREDVERQVARLSGN